MSLKQSIDNTRELVELEKEALSSETYNNIQNELCKINDMRNENVFVKLTVLHQELKECNSYSDNGKFIMSKHIETKYYPLSVFRNHYDAEGDTYIATFDDLKQHSKKYRIINFVNKRSKTDLIMLVDNDLTEEVYEIGNEFEPTKAVEVKYAEYILLDCELV